MYDKETTRLKTYELQQLLLAKQQQPQVHHVNPEDSRSETSGETTDSGRGASEEEAQSTSPPHSKACFLFETQSMCSLSKEQSKLSRETIQNAYFFQNYALFSN